MKASVKDRFIEECARLFHNRWLRDHLSLSFYIQFVKQCINIVFSTCFSFFYREENYIDR